jgi:hypothetical protein
MHCVFAVVIVEVTLILLLFPGNLVFLEANGRTGKTPLRE